MFVELLDKLRCPNDHADAWLVATASRTEHRHLLDATLGCPECDAEFALRDGEVWFGVEGSALVTTMTVNAESTMRVAALLNLRERGLFALEGAWGSFAAGLRALLDVDLLLVDPPTSAPVNEAQGTLRGVVDRWPLAPSSLHGLVLDHATPSRLADAVRVLRSNGRLVAPADAALPAGVRELARDADAWVAEKVGDVIPLTRKR